ncbi:MAG TPA: DUF3147 family protein [Candidatus Methylacidiphilales bacterium]|jgi:hypothetical protein|nr:DUF3147 family protein [Candidatus Methylacidiphilales bacterium]
MNPFLKIILSALLIWSISEISRRNTSVAALLASLPLISLLSMIWMYHDTHDVARIASFSWSVIWYVLPSLILFALLPPLLTRWQFPFYAALFLASAATIAAFFVIKALLKLIGVTF